MILLCIQIKRFVFVFDYSDWTWTFLPIPYLLNVVIVGGHSKNFLYFLLFIKIHTHTYPLSVSYGTYSASNTKLETCLI